ncbi:hypothetical protein KQI65_17675 [bacterium]|nr:hypothetical protein [bacterium]
MPQSVKTEVKGFVQAALWLLLLLGIVDGILPTLQMTLLDGRVFASGVIVKAALLLILAFAYRAHVDADPEHLNAKYILVSSTLVFLIYATLRLLVAMWGGQFNLTHVLADMNAYYGYLPAVMLAALLPGILSGKRFIPVTASVVIMLAAFGLLQVVVGQPFTGTASVNASYVVHSWMFYDSLRAFSLFSSPSMFGMFMLFALLIMLAQLRMEGQHRVLIAAGLVFAAAAVIVTMTRQVYLLTVWSVLVLLLWRQLRSFRYLIPAASLLLALAVLLLPLQFGSSAPGLLSHASLLQRFQNWQFHLQALADGGAAAWLFGLAVTQHGSQATQLPVLIDNTPLALVVHLGFVGFGLFLTIFLAGWEVLFQRTVRFPSPLTRAAVVFWSGWPIAWCFSIAIVPYLLVLLLAVLIREQMDSTGIPS